MQVHRAEETRRVRERNLSIRSSDDAAAWRISRGVALNRVGLIKGACARLILLPTATSHGAEVSRFKELHHFSR